MSRTYVVDLRLTVTVDDPSAVDAESWDEVVPFIEQLVHEDLEGDPIDEDGMSVRFEMMSLEETLEEVDGG